jgi:hypothetical protein
MHIFHFDILQCIFLCQIGMKHGSGRPFINVLASWDQALLRTCQTGTGQAWVVLCKTSTVVSNCWSHHACADVDKAQHHLIGSGVACSPSNGPSLDDCQETTVRAHMCGYGTLRLDCLLKVTDTRFKIALPVLPATTGCCCQLPPQLPTLERSDVQQSPHYRDDLRGQACIHRPIGAVAMREQNEQLAFRWHSDCPSST